MIDWVHQQSNDNCDSPKLNACVVCMSLLFSMQSLHVVACCGCEFRINDRKPVKRTASPNNTTPNIILSFFESVIENTQLPHYRTNSQSASPFILLLQSSIPPPRRALLELWNEQKRAAKREEGRERESKKKNNLNFIGPSGTFMKMDVLLANFPATEVLSNRRPPSFDAAAATTTLAATSTTITTTAIAAAPHYRLDHHKHHHNHCRRHYSHPITAATSTAIFSPSLAAAASYFSFLPLPLVFCSFCSPTFLTSLLLFCIFFFGGGGGFSPEVLFSFHAFHSIPTRFFFFCFVSLPFSLHTSFFFSSFRPSINL